MKLVWAYFASLFFITFFTYLFVDPNFYPLKALYSGFAFQNRQVVTILYSLLVVVFFAFYLYVINLNRDKKLNKEQNLFLIFGSVSLLFFSYPAMLSYDIFNYLTTAKVLFGHLENPYLVMPIEFISDPTLLYTHAANKLALYGPSWIMITAVPYIFSFGNILLAIVNLKVINVLFFALSLYLLNRLGKSYFPVILFGLNPLVLIETMVSGHNDIVLISFSLLSFYLLFNQKKILSSVSLILSIFVKYATAFLLPIYLYAMFSKTKLRSERIFELAAYSMLGIFFLSSFREEIYPWYAIWFLPFIYLSKNKFLLGLSFVLSFFLIFRYVPFMYLGTHFGLTPYLKILVTFVPLVIYVVIYPLIKDRINFKW